MSDITPPETVCAGCLARDNQEIELRNDIDALKLALATARDKALEEGAAAERARIVAWLREKTADLVYAFPSVEPLWPQIVAAIEQGAHAREKP